MTLREAAIEALEVLAVLKITDKERPYVELSPLLRSKLYVAHDKLVRSLLDTKNDR